MIVETVKPPNLTQIFAYWTKLMAAKPKKFSQISGVKVWPCAADGASADPQTAIRGQLAKQHHPMALGQGARSFAAK